MEMAIKHCRPNLFRGKLASYAPPKSISCSSQALGCCDGWVLLGCNVCTQPSSAASHIVRATFRRIPVGNESPAAIQTPRLLLTNICRCPFGCGGLLDEPGGDRGGCGNGQNGKR